MSGRITDKDIQEFLKSYEETSETIILEEGKEREDLEKIAKARGIQIKGSRDLAIFKNVYAFVDKPNANGAILPKNELLKVLPQIVGKPINVNHDRRYVVGHYIDYRYIQASKKVITYGIFYKGCFGAEYNRAKELLKAKKLSSSFEIWSPEDKRQYREDGSFEMYQMEIAGGALIYEDKDNQPAFKGAKVLTLANEEKTLEPQLVYASKYKEKEMLHSDDNNKIIPSPTILKINCSNCSEEIEHNGVDVQIKCPKCFAILNKEGTMQYPPQIKDFRVLCPSCRTGRWLILSRTDDNAKLRCSQCSKEYEVMFEKTTTNDAVKKISFVYTSTVTCPQCSKTIYIAGVSGMNSRDIKCKKCGVEFPYNITEESFKRISKIKEVIPKEIKIDSKKESSEEGGQEMKKEKKVVKASKKDEFDGKSFEKTKEIIHDRLANAKVEPKPEEKVETKEEAKETPKAEVKAEEKPEVIVEEKVEDKKEEAKEEKVEEKPEVKANIENPKAEEPKSEVKAEEKVEVKEEKVTPEPKKEEVIVEEKVEDKKEETPTESKSDLEIKRYKAGVRKMAKKIKELRKEKASLDKKVILYADNAKTIISRRVELDADSTLTDEDILNDDKFANAKLEKENLVLKAKSEKTDDLVGSKKRDGDYYTKRHKAIDAEAFGKVNKKNKK